jgi:hypothetical protein
MALGYKKIRLKSANVRDRPRPTIIMAIARGMSTRDRKLACMRKFLNLAGK